MKKNFKKSDLKTGDIIENEKGKFGKVLIGTYDGDVIAAISGDDHETWFGMHNIHSDLCVKDSDKDYNIIRVWHPQLNIFGASIEKKGTLIWEYQEEPTLITYKDVKYSESTIISMIEKAIK